MRQTLFSLLALLCCAAAHAEIQIDSQDCGVEIDQRYQIGPESLQVFRSVDGAEQFRFDAEAGLVVAGEAVTLDDAQRSLLWRYHGELYAASQETVLIIVEAVELAAGGVQLAMAILGADELALGAVLQEARRQALAELSPQDAVYRLGPGGIDQIDEVFDEDLERKIEAAALEAGWQLGWRATLAALTGGKSLEARAERLTAEREAALEARGDEIEARAETLCRRLETLVTLETELHRAIPALAGHSMLRELAGLAAPPDAALLLASGNAEARLRRPLLF